MRALRTAHLLVLVLALCVLALHARIVVGAMTWDDVRYHSEIAPPRLAAADAITSGQLPTWWEGSGLGVPLAGEPSHGAAYPGLWLAVSPFVLDLVWVGHLIVLALGIAFWARRYGASELSSILAGVLVAASGIATSAAIRGALPALALLPWVGWAASRLHAEQRTGRQTVRRTSQIVLSLALGLVGLGGELAIFVPAIVVAVVIARPSRDLAVAVSSGIAIAAPQWIPAVYVIVSTAGADVEAMKLSRALELIIPGSFGAGSPERAVPAIAGANPQWPSLFVGVAIFAAAAVAAIPRRLAIVGGGLAVLACVVGRGGTPHWLGAPDVHIAMIVVLCATHASTGFDMLLAGERRARRALAVGIGASALGLGAVALLRTRLDIPAVDDGLVRALVDGAIGTACLAGAYVLSTRIRARYVVALLLAAPTLGAIGTTSPLVDRALVETPPPWADAAATVDMKGAPRRLFRPLSLFEAETPSSVADAVATLTGTIGDRFGIGSARSEDPARPRIHDRAWLAAASFGGTLLERYGVALAILPASVVDGRKLVELSRRGTWSLARFPVSPPASVISEWVSIADDAAALARLFPLGAGRGLPGNLVIIRGHGPDHQDEPAEAEPCIVTRWTAGVIDLTCTANEAALAVVSSTAADGWTVHVAGVNTPWLTADLMRRAVPIPAGPSVVSWRYEAPGLLLGVLVALAGLVVVLGLVGNVALDVIRRRRHTRDQASRETN